MKSVAPCGFIFSIYMAGLSMDTLVPTLQIIVPPIGMLSLHSEDLTRLLFNKYFIYTVSSKFCLHIRNADFPCCSQIYLCVAGELHGNRVGRVGHLVLFSCRSEMKRNCLQLVWDFHWFY